MNIIEAISLQPMATEELLNENRSHDRFGQFQVVAFWNNRDGLEHAAFVRGDVTGADEVPVRMHSGVSHRGRHRITALRLPRPTRDRKDVASAF